jgi:hypothetical protein
MASQEEFDSKIALIIPEWDKAENYIKVAEQIGGKVVFPSIKELRYAGRRIADALKAKATGDLEKAVEYLVDAHFNCCRSRHDAVDASVSTMATEISVLTRKVGFDPVIRAFPEFHNLNAMVIDSQKMIAASRQDRENRELIYASVEGVPFQKIVDLYRSFQANEHVIRSIAKSERRKKFWGAVGVGLSLLIAGLSLWASWDDLKKQFGIRDAVTFPTPIEDQP